MRIYNSAVLSSIKLSFDRRGRCKSKTRSFSNIRLCCGAYGKVSYPCLGVMVAPSFGLARQAAVDKPDIISSFHRLAEPDMYLVQ